MKAVYLAGPINRVGFEAARGWRRSAAKALRYHGYEIFDPTEFELGAGANVVEADKHMLRKSSAVLAFVPDDVQAVGTCMEIFYAHSLGLPVFAFGSERPSPWLLAHTCLVSSDTDPATAILHLRTLEGA